MTKVSRTIVRSSQKRTEPMNPGLLFVQKFMLQNLEFNYSGVYTEGTAGAYNSEKDQGQGEATPIAAKDWSQDSLECNKAYGIAVLENNAYESMTDSGTVEKYDYIPD